MKKFNVIFSLLMVVAVLVALPGCSSNRYASLAKKEAKKLTRSGYQTMRLPIQQQLEDYYAKSYENGPDGTAKYLQSTGLSVAGTYNAARLSAVTSAKVSMASDIQSVVISQSKVNIANKQLDSRTAATIDEVLSKSTEMVAQRMGNVVVAQEYYRVLSNNNYEVRVVLLYDKSTMQEMLLQDVRDQLQAKLDNMNLVDDVVRNVVAPSLSGIGQ